MFSRRLFLISSLSALSALIQPYAVLAKKRANKSVAIETPHLLAVQPWSPTITADFVALLGNGMCCVANEFGKLLIVDLFKPGATKNTASVVSELNCTGTKVIDFALWQKKAVLLGIDVNQKANQQFSLKIISLTKISAPYIVSSLSLKNYSEVTHLSFNQNMVCLIGKSINGDQLLSIYDIGPSSPKLLATLVLPDTIKAPIKCLAQINKSLVILSESLHSRESDQLTLVNIANARNGIAECKASVSIKGEYTNMSCTDTTALLLGPNQRSTCEATLVSLHPEPNVISSLTLKDTQAIVDVSRYKDNFLVLCSSLSTRRLMSLKVDKALNLQQTKYLALDKNGTRTNSGGKLAVNNNFAVVAAGTAGVEVYSNNQTGWNLTANYSLPRLPASGIASCGNFVITGGADLRLYDISQATKPILVNTVPMLIALKAIAATDKFILSLGKDSLALRKIDKPEEIIAQAKTAAQQMCFDSFRKSAYLLNTEKNKTTADQYDVVAENIVSRNSFELQNNFTRAVCQNNQLLAANLHDMDLYQLKDKAELLGSKHFEDVAIRDFAISANYIFATTIDRYCHASLIVLSKIDNLKLIASIDLPHDGLGVTVSGNRVVTIGSTGAAQDIISIINVDSPSAPKIVVSLPTIESSSSVTINQKLAIVAGRGLAIFAL